MTVDILVILKSVKKMLVRALPTKPEKSDPFISVENALDLVDELIKQLETPPKKILSPADEELDETARAAKADIL